MFVEIIAIKLLILLFQTGLFLNPIFNGNWPQVVIDRVESRRKLLNTTHSRLPKFTIEEIQRIKGTTDFLAVNHYMTFLVENVPEATDGVSCYKNDTRYKLSVNPDWKLGTNDFPVHKIFGS